MFSVTVRDHIMIAHSLTGEVFGPAQRLHGATYTVDVEFRRGQLDRNGIVIDIGLAGQLLHDVLQSLNYRNLDDLPEFDGVNTTTEVLAQTIFERLKSRLAEHTRVAVGAGAVETMKVTLTESPTAWAAYEAPLT
ncbi:6-carboxy-5,6,7,8-tetrahydropterin synthase [Candidatus Entotheonellaceae bacterium PAL068K]